jgi:hemoglobin
MNEIETQEDIVRIIRKFYDKLLFDDSINFFLLKSLL